jgi:hypothetical protein
MKRLLISCSAFIFLSGSFWFESLFVPDAEPWLRWEKHDPASTARIDHSDWDLILKYYIRPGPDGVNRFAYSRLSIEDATLLYRYVDRLAAISISQFNRREQLAYWINFYNALTIQVVATHYPIASIREIDLGGGGFGGGPWAKKLVAVEGEELSLNDIEHRILRPIWQDPRTHYAVNCASIGCPNLRRSAYEGDTVNRVLQSAARDYVNNPRGVSIKNGDLVVSSLYVWFRSDFGDSDAAILEHLRRYAGPTLKSVLDGRETIADHRYDWGLNGTNLSPGR